MLWTCARSWEQRHVSTRLQNIKGVFEHPLPTSCQANTTVRTFVVSGARHKHYNIRVPSDMTLFGIKAFFEHHRNGLSITAFGSSFSKQETAATLLSFKQKDSRVSQP
jgi:hypothetical protein